MMRRFLVVFVLACLSAIASGTEIRPVNSWAHYREVLKSDGKSEAEIDAEIDSCLADLKAMDRAAGDRCQTRPVRREQQAARVSGRHRL